MIRVRLFVWALLALAALASVASAQTPEVIAGTPITLKADHDGVNTDGYRVFIDGTQVAQVTKATALAAGVVTITVQAGVSRGAHSVEMAAYNADQATRSAPLAFTAKLPAPGPFNNLRFVVASQAADGSMQMHLLDLAAARQVLELPPLE